MIRLHGPAWLVLLLILSGTGFAQQEAASESTDETTQTAEVSNTEGDAEASEVDAGAGDETGEEASPQRPPRPPVPNVSVVREAYDSRCSEVAFRMALEPAALTLGDLERLTDCIKALRGGAEVTDNSPQLLCSQYCGSPAPRACPPPPRPNLEALCPPFIEEQRQQRSEDRRQRQVRPHIPGL